MADNVAISAGTGTAIATDQVTTTNEHVQLFKLAYSADGSRVLVQADINGLLVTVATLPLPTGAATSALQTTGNTALASLDTKLTNPLPVSAASLPLPSGAATNTVLTDGTLRGTVALSAGSAVVGHVIVDTAPTTAVTGTFFQGTQPISAVALPLPSGAATNTVLTDGTLRGTVALSAGSAVVGHVINDASSAVIGHVITDATSVTTATLSAETTKVIGTVNVASGQALQANAGTNLNTSLLALEAGHLAAIDTSTAKIPALGQAVAAASVPVVLTAAQLTTLTPPAAIAGFALDATVAKDASLVTLNAKDFATSAKQDTNTTAVTALTAAVALESGGNLAMLQTYARVRNALLLQQLLQASPSNGFVPIEVPAFLIG